MYRLIIADDKALVRAGLFYRNDWNAMGFEVVAMLEDGSDVLEFLEKERVDVILADICMYSVSGLEVAKIVWEKYPKTKVVLLSAYQEFEFAKEALLYHVYDYLLKPIDYEKLHEVFEKLRRELDAKRQSEFLQKWFGEKEYEQSLYLLKNLSAGVLDEGKNSWQSYVHMESVLRGGPSKMSGIVAMDMLDLLQSQLMAVDETLAKAYKQKMHRLYEAEEMQSNLYECLCQLEDELVAHNLLPAFDPKDDCILEACDYIKKHLGDELTLQGVANHVHLSKRHFARRFCSQMGENFNSYAHRMRMEEAVRLLREGCLNSEEIGERVGYRDYKYFQQLVKKYTGHTVRELQKRNSL